MIETIAENGVKAEIDMPVQATANTDKIKITPVKVGATNAQTIEYITYYFFGALEILLAFRLILKLLGASMASTFVQGIYGLSSLFTYPFEGIFRKSLSSSVEFTSVLEPGTFVAIIVYAIVAWGIVKLVRISSKEQLSN